MKRHHLAWLLRAASVAAPAAYLQFAFHWPPHWIAAVIAYPFALSLPLLAWLLYRWRKRNWRSRMRDATAAICTAVGAGWSAAIAMQLMQRYALGGWPFGREDYGLALVAAAVAYVWALRWWMKVCYTSRHERCA